MPNVRGEVMLAVGEKPKQNNGNNKLNEKLVKDL